MERTSGINITHHHEQMRARAKLLQIRPPQPTFVHLHLERLPHPCRAGTRLRLHDTGRVVEITDHDHTYKPRGNFFFLARVETTALPDAATASSGLYLASQSTVNIRKTCMHGHKARRCRHTCESTATIFRGCPCNPSMASRCVRHRVCSHNRRPLCHTCALQHKFQLCSSGNIACLS